MKFIQTSYATILKPIIEIACKIQKNLSCNLSEKKFPKAFFSKVLGKLCPISQKLKLDNMKSCGGQCIDLGIL